MLSYANSFINKECQGIKMHPYLYSNIELINLFKNPDILNALIKQDMNDINDPIEP